MQKTNSKWLNFPKRTAHSAVVVKSEGGVGGGMPERVERAINWIKSVDGEKIEKLQREKDGAYSERDKLVCALSKLFPAWLERHPDSDTTWDDDWRWIVFIEIPTGQISWHIHDSELDWFAHLERKKGNSWDGHTTEEKYRRLAVLKAIKND